MILSSHLFESRPIAVLLMAAILDFSIGDPWGWPHPVQMMGWAIAQTTQRVFNRWNPWVTPVPIRALRWAGVVLAIVLIIGSGTVSWLLVQAANWLSPLCGFVVETILLASCFAGRSLRAAAEDVLHPINQGDLVKARERLSLYVGRDTEHLSLSEILRAVLETVAENGVDGVTAPLFYAGVGTIVPHLLLLVTSVGGSVDRVSINLAVPFAIAYKAASTLDSMVGYKEPPYTDIGWCSAKLEDRLTWLPCRFTVILIALLSGTPFYIWRICQRDAMKDPSPNSGWSECAYAATLKVQLGGINSYRGVIKQKPLLGEPIEPITADRIYQALQLTRSCFLIELGLSCLLYPLFFVH